MEDYWFPCEPVANAESIVSGSHYRFSLLDDKVLRYEWAGDGIFEDRASTFAVNRKFPRPKFRIENQDDQLDIFTPAFHLTYDKQRFSRNGFSVQFNSKQTEWGRDWKYGEDAQDNLGGTARTIDMVDGRCDLGIGIISKAGYATVDDSESMLFDGKGFVASRRSGDRIDGYLFAYGRDFKGAMESFYSISGSQPSVPRWCLGNWWSRFYPYSEDSYLALMDKFKANDIPLSVAVIDMDWHVREGDNVPHAGWTGYTWNRDLFPNPERFMDALHSRQLKTCMNDHPHAGIHCHEEIYEDMAKALNHDTSHKAPILFEPTSPKFMYAYFNVLYRKLEEQGEDFRWIDWQQGPDSRIPGLDPLWLLNHFHYLDTVKSKGESQTIIFSRYGGLGSHRYPVGFSGDAVATWSSLEFQPEFTATASNVGYGWWSHDIGGHIEGSRDDELTVRWVQLGAFSPILRLHSSNSPWMSKEPWLYRNESEAAMTDVMQLRHRMVPYIFSLVGSGASTDLPLIQPLYWGFPGLESAYKYPTEYFFGSQVIAAPILQPRDKATNLAKAKVWVPPGRHVDVLTGYVYDGDQEINMYRALDRLPLFAAEGSIIPLDGELVPANGCPNPQSFEVLVVAGRNGRFDIVELERDDKNASGDAHSKRSIQVEYDQGAGRVKVAGSARHWTFRFVSVKIDPETVRVFVDGAESSKTCKIEYTNTVPSLVVGLKAPKNSDSLITIELGADPQLVVNDYTELIRSFVLDFQISNLLKNDIWEIIEAKSSTTTKIARLIALELDKNVFGPIAELLLADSR